MSFILKELSSIDVYMESCTCLGCWVCCNPEAIRTGICVSDYESYEVDLICGILFLMLLHNTFSLGSTSLELGEICKDVGLPSGVLNILTGFGPEAGAPLASHPHVDKVWLSL